MASSLQDPDRIPIKIGGEIVQVPPLVWKSLKILWPILQPKATTPDTTFEQMVETAQQVVSCALMFERPELTPEELSMRMRWDECNEILGKSTELLTLSGFNTVGEATATSQAMVEKAEESPSTETLNGSSPNASPEVSTDRIGNA